VAVFFLNTVYIAFYAACCYGPIKPQSNGPLHSNTVIVHWLLMSGQLHLVQRGRGLAVPDVTAQSPPRCTKCSSTFINGQCINFVLFDVAL